MAGSDCSGGAGAQADLKTFTAFGCYGLTALTSVVAEVPAKVTRIQLLEGAMVEEQINVLAEALPIAAAKTGMLGGTEQIKAVVSAWGPLAQRGIPLVVDPVMVATSGGRLLTEDAMETLVRDLFPLATVLTPNMDEAAVLLGGKIGSREAMEAAARVLSARYGCAVLIKGGHLAGEDAPDVLVGGTGSGGSEGVVWLEGKRTPGVHTHGTGCTFSAAIAAGLAHGRSLEEAVRDGKRYVAAAIEGYFRWGGVDALNHGALRVE